MSNNKTVHIVIFGIGKVGSTLISQINAVKSKLQQRQNLQLRIPIVANSKLAFYDKDGISNGWETDYETFSVPYKIDEIIQFVKQQKLSNLIAVDATASSDFTKNYLRLIESGFNIVSANKVANTLDYAFYKAIRNALKKHNKSFLYETNVGAGLPVIETVKNLYNSGEQIQRIRGVFSGSLSYIFNEFSETDVTFSKVLENASKLGLTEPDAREDLSGNDVARKLLILARELHLKTEFRDVKIESLVPKRLNGKTTLHQFNNRTKELDVSFEKLKQELPKKHVLRYVGELDVQQNTLEVKLISEDKTTAIGQLKGADSVFEIFTESYGKQPLVIQGAGAGKEVTARGVLSDVIKLSNSLN
ncbi:MAG: aspartate kinase [Bacteroidetes bacterium]|nr:MAG: aspartate kinase [Bacteroidota bacterium]